LQRKQQEQEAEDEIKRYEDACRNQIVELGNVKIVKKNMN
jgi:hypothetical protein